MISFTSKGSFKQTDNFLTKMLNLDIASRLRKYGQQGVNALSAATPKESGLSADSWAFEVKGTRGSAEIIWTNSNVTSSGVPIVILLQYGHGTGTGGYVQGYDFINPAVKPIFDRIAVEVWKEVTTA